MAERDGLLPSGVLRCGAINNEQSCRVLHLCQRSFWLSRGCVLVCMRVAFESAFFFLDFAAAPEQQKKKLNTRVLLAFFRITLEKKKKKKIN